MDAKELVKELSRYANHMNHDKSAFSDAILREHRTLQQSIFGLFLKTIEGWSQTEHFDLRNAYAVEKSKEIMDLLGHSETPFV